MAALVLPQDDLVKAYLLDGAGRHALAARGGGVYQTLAGAASLFPLLSDRAFVCLHYRLAHDGLLEPCHVPPGSATGSQSQRAQCVGQAGEGPHVGAQRQDFKDGDALGGAIWAGSSCGLATGSHTSAEPAADTIDAAHPDAQRGPAVTESDVQIGLLVRKGVGGTCPARTVARRLSTEGLLPALLDPCPYLMGPGPPLLASAASPLHGQGAPRQVLMQAAQPQQPVTLPPAATEEPCRAESGQQPAKQPCPQAHMVLQAPVQLCAATSGMAQQVPVLGRAAAGQQAPASGAVALALRAQPSLSDPTGARKTSLAAAHRDGSGQPGSGAAAVAAGALCSQAAGHQVSPAMPGSPAACEVPRVAEHGLAGHCDAAEDREGLDDLLNEMRASPRRARLVANAQITGGYCAHRMVRHGAIWCDMMQFGAVWCEHEHHYGSSSHARGCDLPVSEC